ncbi:MAG: nucleotidyltransferase family protein [Hyphomicrobium sp.]
MKVSGLHVPERAIAQLCRRHHIRRLALFGSVLRGELRPDSDLDVLVEFEPGHTPGFGFFEIEDELTRVLGRKVDLNTPQFLSRHFRKKIEAEAEVVFGQE